MPRDRSYDPFGEARANMPMPPMNVKNPVTQEPVENFRLTDDMKGFSAMFKKVLDLAGQLQKGLFSAAGEFQRRRNLFADVVGELVNLSNAAPKNKMTGINPEPNTEGYNEEATQENPFNLQDMSYVLRRRKGLTE